MIPFDLTDVGGTLICQKDSFLCAAKGISVGIAFQKKIGVGLFGGEGLVLATLTGPGTVWLQSLPFSRMADRILTAGKKGGKGEGSILSNAGIGNLLGGDR